MFFFSIQFYTALIKCPILKPEQFSGFVKLVVLFCPVIRFKEYRTILYYYKQYFLLYFVILSIATVFYYIVLYGNNSYYS